MENTHAPKRAAVVYAILSLIARLIASQSSVFGLWFGRRCYERSRGEMIMMLYEKMLTRKVIGLRDKQYEGGSDAFSVSDTTSNTEQMAKLDGKSGQVKQSASMGKVINLMR